MLATISLGKRRGTDRYSNLSFLPSPAVVTCLLLTKPSWKPENKKPPGVVHVASLPGQGQG